jgi:hypothetical protein
MSKYRLELLTLDLIGCNGDFVWLRSAKAADLPPSVAEA